MQRAAVAAGQLAADEAYAAQLWPREFLDAVDVVLADYERDVAALGADPADEPVWAAVQQVVEGLNDADDGSIETGEREDLAAYVEAVLTAAGIDVVALTGRRGLHLSELTDEWREW